MKKILITYLLILSYGCTSIVAIQPGGPGPLPSEDFAPKIGFEPLEKALNKNLLYLKKLRKTNSDGFLDFQDPDKYYYGLRNIDNSKIKKFEENYGPISEKIEALLINTDNNVVPYSYTRGFAFSDSGLYIMGIECDVKRDENDHTLFIPQRSFISYDDLYDPSTRISFRKLWWDTTFALTDLNYYVIKTNKGEFCIEELSRGSKNIIELIFISAGRFARSGDYVIYESKIRNYQIKELPDTLVNIFKGNQEDWAFSLDFNGSIPKKTEERFRKCMNLSQSDEILFVWNPNTKIFPNTCHGALATQSGLHLENMWENDYNEVYKYIPYSYYLEHPDFKYSLPVGHYSFFGKKFTSINYLDLHPSFSLELAGYIHEREIVAFLIMALIDAIQGNNMPTSEEIAQMVDDYEKLLDEKRKIPKLDSINNKDDLTLRVQKNNSIKSGKGFFKTIGDILMPIIEIATILAIADSLGDNTCDMPRKPRANQNYGSQMLNREPLRPPKDFNKQIAAYNKNLAKAKKHCDSKKNDLSLLLGWLD